MTDRKSLLLPVILTLLTGCHPSPSLSWQLTLFKGASINPYLAAHRAPDKIAQDADGGVTYTWVYMNETKEAAQPNPASVAAYNSLGNKDYGRRLDGAATALLTLTAINKETTAQPAVSAVTRKITIIAVHTDAAKKILDYTCDHVTAPG